MGSDFDWCIDIGNSPYCNFVAIRFSDQVLQVHRFILEKSESLCDAVSARNEVDLSNISGVTGHILVNYLYTGTLDGIKDIPTIDVLPVIFDVYSTAKRFQMDGLRRTTQTEIESHTSGMSPADALTAIKKACPLPDVTDVWLRDYSKTLLAAAFDDVTSFLDSDIMAEENAESNISITEMLLRAILSSAKEKKEAQRAAAEQAAIESTWGEERLKLRDEKLALEAKLARKGKLRNTDRARLDVVQEMLDKFMADDSSSAVEVELEPELDYQ